MSQIVQPKIDTIFYWKGNGDGWGKWDSHCRIRIFFPKLAEGYSTTAVVVATEQKDNKGTSITNCVEYLVPMVLKEFGLESTSTVWIEHYSEDSYEALDLKDEFSRVDLTWVGNRASCPKWHWISCEDVQKLVGTDVFES